MADLNLIKPVGVQNLINKFCYTIGMLPTSYKSSLTYEEQILAIGNYLETTVYPAINNNAEALSELQGAFITLKDYVDNYFDNLDVQEEINNKLDEMLEDGSLKDILDELFADYQVLLNQEKIERQDADNDIISKINNDKNELTEKINEEKNDRETSDLNLQNQINSLVSSAPIPVSSIDQMTDTTKIYLNISNGYWYYYNGTAWTQGGQYQASQSTDEIEGIKNYLQNENLKNIIDWIVGDISNGSVVTGNVYRIVTNSIQCFPYDIIINIDTDTKTFLWTYADSSGNSPNGSGWLQDEKRPMIIPANTYFRLVREYIDVSNPNRVAITNILTSDIYNRTNIYKYFEYQKRINLADFDINSENLKYNILFNVGEINNGALQIIAGTNRRIVTQKILKFDFDILLPKAIEGVSNAWYLVTYDNGNEANYHNVGWVNNGVDYTIQAGTYFRILGAYTTAYNTPVYNLFSSYIYKTAKLYKKQTDTELSIIKYNENMKSVAHQGYSLTDNEGHSTVNAFINAKNHGFQFAECDIKYTSDGKIVACHNDTFVSGGQTITISEHTLSELKQYDYYGDTIASLDELVETCKKLGMGIYIDQLPSYDLTKYTELFNTIDKYQMANNTYFLTSTSSIISKILEKYPNANIVITTSEINSTIINLANSIKTNINHISIDVDYHNLSTSDILNIKSQILNGIDIEAWTIDNSSTYISYLPYLTRITSNKLCYNDIYNSL